MLPITVEPVLFLYMMIIFMESNALQELIYVKTCIKMFHPENITECSYDLKQNMTDAVNEATLWSKYNNLMLSSFTFVSSFYVGSWCDRFGRKLPMLIPPVGSAIAATINAILSFYLETHAAYFLVSAFISGISFGTVGIIASTFGFIADFTHEQSRTKRIVILESMIFIGGTIGIYVAGAFLKHAHYEDAMNRFVWLFAFEALVAVTIVAYVVFRIPSRATDVQTLQRPLSVSSLLDLRHVVDSVRTIFRPREDRKREKIILMLVAIFLIYFGSVVQLNLGYYFAKEGLKWSFQKYSNFHSMLFAVEGVALVLIFPVLYRFPWVPDHFVGILGLISRTAGFVVFGLSNSDYMLYSCIALYIFSEFPVPALRSMLSKTVDADEKGRIFAFTTILQNLCYLIGSFVLMTVFTEFSFHGLCFEVVAALQALALIIIVYLYLTRRTLVTIYESFENEDGSTTVISSLVAASDPVN